MVLQWRGAYAHRSAGARDRGTLPFSARCRGKPKGAADLTRRPRNATNLDRFAGRPASKLDVHRSRNCPVSPLDPLGGMDESQCERAHKGSIDENAGLQVPCNPASSLERATGIEPATSSLGSWHSAAELRPHLPRSLVRRPAPCQWRADPRPSPSGVSPRDPSSSGAAGCLASQARASSRVPTRPSAWASRTRRSARPTERPRGKAQAPP